MRSSLACVLGLMGCDAVFGIHTVVPPPDSAPDSPRPDGEPVGCPAGYDEILQQTASRYRVVQSTEKFPAAAADCANDAPGLTHLIVLSNREEWLGLATIPPEPPRFLFIDNTWIGASDTVSGDLMYRWVTDEVTGGFTVPAVVGADPWESDQPDPDGSCAALRPTNVLHSEKCDNSANYICECDGRPDVPANY